MLGSFDKSDVRFFYPENWQIVDEDLDQWPHRVSVQSPEGGYWELHVWPTRMDAAKLSGEALRAMRMEYADVESERVLEHLGDVPSMGYDLSFFYLDFLITCKIRALNVGSRTYLLIYQAESREFDRQASVFEAITHSLLNGRLEDGPVKP